MKRDLVLHFASRTDYAHTPSGVHLEVRIAPEAIDGDERRAVSRREAFFGAAVAAHLPRGANELRELIGGRPPRAAAAAGRCRASA